MTDLIRGACLGEEAALEAGVHVELRVQHLERDLGARELVAGTQNHAHATGSERALDGVAPVDHSPDVVSQA